MGLAIAYSVAMALPVIGGDVAHLIRGGEFPGHVIQSRLFIGHVFLLPALVATLIALHLTLIVRTRHTQFRDPPASERHVAGTPMWPGYALRSVSLLLLVASLLFALGGLVQINPIWQWEPYEPWLGTNGAQPDWYLGWLIGARRITPPVDVVIGGYTVIPAPFWGGIAFPGVVFTVLYLWPWIEQRLITRDLSRHELLDAPRDNPRRTAIGAAFFVVPLVVYRIARSWTAELSRRADG